MKEGDKGAGVAHATPRPWKTEPESGITGGTWEIFDNDSWPIADVWPGGVGAEVAAANADLIVRAVNAHDELVAALKAAYGTILDADLPTERENEVCDQIARALDKVEA